MRRKVKVSFSVRIVQTTKHGKGCQGLDSIQKAFDATLVLVRKNVRYIDIPKLSTRYPWLWQKKYKVLHLLVIGQQCAPSWHDLQRWFLHVPGVYYVRSMYRWLAQGEIDQQWAHGAGLIVVWRNIGRHPDGVCLGWVSTVSAVVKFHKAFFPESSFVAEGARARAYLTTTISHQIVSCIISNHVISTLKIISLCPRVILYQYQVSLCENISSGKIERKDPYLRGISPPLATQDTGYRAGWFTLSVSWKLK